MHKVNQAENPKGFFRMVKIKIASDDPLVYQPYMTFFTSCHIGRWLHCTIWLPGGFTHVRDRIMMEADYHSMK